MRRGSRRLNSSTSAPSPRKPATSAAMRSLSFTRSSAAPVTEISPPCVASAASAGSSSMRPGTSTGSISTGRSDACLTVSEPSGSAPDAVDPVARRRARPSARGRRGTPCASGSRPRHRCSTDGPGSAGRGGGPERGRREVAGHRDVGGRQRLPPATRHPQRLDRDVGAERRQRPLGVVAGLRGLGHRRDALGVQAGQQHGALDLRAGDGRLVARSPCRGRPSTVSGGHPPVGGRCARPSAPAGRSRAASAGGDSDASPVSVAANRWPASTPIRKRIVVPELPASSGAAGGTESAQAAAPRRARRCRPGRGLADGDAERRRHASVDRQSPPGASPRIVVRPVARAARMSVPVRDRLVARHAHGAPEAAGRRDDALERQGSRLHYSISRVAGLWYGESRGGRR